MEGPLGYRVKPLVCKYSNRNDGGRLYATGGARIQDFGAGFAYSVSIQGVPREIRDFLCCRWSHDYDLSNAQPEMLRQLAGLLTWADGRSKPELPIMEQWCAQRSAFRLPVLPLPLTVTFTITFTRRCSAQHVSGVPITCHLAWNPDGGRYSNVASRRKRKRAVAETRPANPQAPTGQLFACRSKVARPHRLRLSCAHSQDCGRAEWSRSESSWPSWHKPLPDPYPDRAVQMHLL